jgi:hypothetical protein
MALTEARLRCAAQMSVWVEAGFPNTWSAGMALKASMPARSATLPEALAFAQVFAPLRGVAGVRGAWLEGAQVGVARGSPLVEGLHRAAGVLAHVIAFVLRLRTTDPNAALL